MGQTFELDAPLLPYETCDLSYEFRYLPEMRKDLAFVKNQKEGVIENRGSLAEDD